MEVTKKILTTLLIGMVSKSLSDWDTKLSLIPSSLTIGLLTMLVLIPLFPIWGMLWPQPSHFF